MARHSLSDVKQQSRNRSGAGEARGAHNPEVVGSNPTSGILSLPAGVSTNNPSSWTLNAASFFKPLPGWAAYRRLHFTFSVRLPMVISLSLNGRRWIETNGWYSSIRAFYRISPSSWTLNAAYGLDIHRYSSYSEGREIDTHCHLRLPCTHPPPSLIPIPL